MAKRYDNIPKIETGLGYHYISGGLLVYSYFKQYHTLIPKIYVSKEHLIISKAYWFKGNTGN